MSDKQLARLQPDLTPANPRCSFTESAPIKIHVEGDFRTFQIHKDRLVSKSGYFKGLIKFKSNLPSTDPNATWSEITLKQADNHDADAFRIIAEWFYEGASALDSLKPDKTGNLLNANRRAQVALTKIYIEADKLIIPALKNDIMDMIHGFSVITLPSLRALRMVMEAIPIETTLKQFLMEGLRYWLRVSPGYLKFNVNGWHLEAAEVLAEDGDLCLEVLRMVCCDQRTYPNPCEMYKCDYHEHGEGAPLERCRSDYNGY